MVVHETKQAADLIESKTELAAATNKGQTLEVRLTINSVTALTARGCEEKAHTLVVANSLNVAAGLIGELAPGKADTAWSSFAGHADTPSTHSDYGM
jgi:hypothetical protein